MPLSLNFLRYRAVAVYLVSRLQMVNRCRNQGRKRLGDHPNQSMLAPYVLQVQENLPSLTEGTPFIKEYGLRRKLINEMLYAYITNLLNLVKR